MALFNFPDCIHLHVHEKTDPETVQELKKISELIHHIINKIEKIMATQQELAAQLTAQGEQLDTITTQVAKIGTETKGLQDAIAVLQGEIGNTENVSPELQAAADNVTAKLVSLTTAVQAVDESVPDAPVTPPTDEPTA